MPAHAKKKGERPRLAMGPPQCRPGSEEDKIEEPLGVTGGVIADGGRTPSGTKDTHCPNIISSSFVAGERGRWEGRGRQIS